MRVVSCDRCNMPLGHASRTLALSEATARPHDTSAMVYFPRALDIGRKLVQSDFCASCLDDLETWFNSKKFEGKEIR
jgi:hypothetical protein